VVESSNEWASQIASALAANAMSFIAPDGSASFVVKNDITAIAQFSNVATFIPVATKTVVPPHCTRTRAELAAVVRPGLTRNPPLVHQVLADELADNPVRLRLAGMTIKAEPTIAKLVADVDADLVKKHDLHLSSYNSRLAISPGGPYFISATNIVLGPSLTLQLHVQPSRPRSGLRSTTLRLVSLPQPPSPMVVGRLVNENTTSHGPSPYHAQDSWCPRSTSGRTTQAP
jgi:hypothetical protein